LTVWFIPLALRLPTRFAAHAISHIAFIEDHLPAGRRAHLAGLKRLRNADWCTNPAGSSVRTEDPPARHNCHCSNLCHTASIDRIFKRHHKSLLHNPIPPSVARCVYSHAGTLSHNPFTGIIRCFIVAYNTSFSRNNTRMEVTGCLTEGNNERFERRSH
jgi:hypothetical protein